MTKQKAKTSKKVAAKLKEGELDKVEGGSETAGVVNNVFTPWTVNYDQGNELGHKVRLPTGVRKGKVY